MKKVLNRWSEPEIQTLRDYCTEGVTAVHAKLPHRSIQAIRTKCCYLGLLLGDANEVTERFFMVI